MFTNSNVTFYVVTGTHLIVAEEFEANFGSPGSAGYAFVDLGYDSGLFSPSDDVVDILARSGTVVRFQGNIEPEGFVAYVVPYGSVIPHATLTHQLGSADRIWTQFYVNTASLQKLYIGSNIAITTQTNNLLLTVSNNTWTFSNTGTIVFPDGTKQTTAYKSTSGSWTLATGSNTVSITVPLNGNYQMWVNGNIPNGIVEWNATVNVSNPNVPAIGSQYAWYYTAGNALVLTAIPNQIVGTVGVISTSSSYVGNTANVFTFGITNNSTSSQVIYWGYTTL